MADESLDRDGWLRVETFADNMEAYLVIEPPTGEGKWPTKEQALELLASENIVFGIDEAAIDEVINFKETKPRLIAVGKPPQRGADAEFKFFFKAPGLNLPQNNTGFTEDEYGRVDYRDLQTVQNIVKGEVLVEKIPATPGEPGYNVYGKVIEPVPGKDKILKVGKNVAWTSDGLKAVAMINGEPSFANNKLSVFPIHEVKGNVNFQTGNIIFLGNVSIQGNVDSGFKVEAEGDIIIRGMVEAAELKAGGNIIINGGVSGMDKTEITCGGDFTAKYVEHATINCGGSVLVKEAIMYCQVNADHRISVESGKGLIVGGVLRAGGEISAKFIGSKFGTVTELEIGVKPKLKMEYQELETQIKENKVNLDKAEKAVALLEKFPNLPKDRQEMLQNLVKTTYVLKNQISQAETRRKEILEEMMVLSKEKARVKVKETLFPGVRISIAKATTVIKDECKFVTLVYNEGEIQVQSYR